VNQAGVFCYLECEVNGYVTLGGAVTFSCRLCPSAAEGRWRHHSDTRNRSGLIRERLHIKRIEMQLISALADWEFTREKNTTFGNRLKYCHFVKAAVVHCSAQTERGTERDITQSLIINLEAPWKYQWLW